MPLTTKDDLLERLYSFDEGHQRHLYTLTHQLLGRPDGADGQMYGGNPTAFPVFPDLMIRQLEVGKSRRALNSALLQASRMMVSDPAPDYLELDQATAEVRKAAFVKRWQGGRVQGGWSGAHQHGFLFGTMIGQGVCVWGPSHNPKTKKGFANCVHVPVYNVWYDTDEVELERARWFAYQQHMTVERAINDLRLTGEAAAAVKEASWLTNAAPGVNRVQRRVTITTYHDLGCNGSDPTTYVLAGDWSKKPLYRGPMPYDQLPESHMEYIAVPGMARPIGKVLFQAATIEMLNELERELRRAVQRGGAYQTIDMSQLDPRDVRDLMAGRTPRFLRLRNPDPQGRPAIVPGQALPLNPASMQLWAVMERQFNADDQTSEMDRGSLSQEQRTLGENQIVQASGQMAMNLVKFQLLKFYTRSLSVWESVARVVEDDPLPVTVFGHSYTLNAENDPTTNLADWLEEPAEATMDRQALEPIDVMQKRAMRQAEVLALADLVDRGLLKRSWWATERLKAVGERDPEELLSASPDQLDAQPAPGAPGMAAPMGPSGMGAMGVDPAAAMGAMAPAG